MSLSIANLGAAGALLLVWLFLSGRHNQQGEKGLRRPPTLPSVIPFIGHLPEFLWDGGKLLRKAASFSGTAVPVRIRLPGFSSFVVSGPEAIQAFFKNTRDLSTTSRSITIMQNAFGCPPHLLDHFRPRPSVDGVQDEVEQAIHRGVQTGLAGAQLSVLADRFQTTLLEKLDTSRCTPGDDGWTDIPDLCEFVQKPVVESVISVFFGPYMISLNPGIVDDFWRWNKDVRLMFMGMPRWWIPGAYRLREKMIQNIIRWQKHARENYKGLGLGEDEWEPFYGSKFIRERQDLLTSRGIMDETARASENLANMWAANSNAVPAAMWFLIEILRDPVLKKEASDCISSALLPAASPAQMQNRVRAMFDAPKLCADPLLQSVYAETLRLRVAALIVREAAHGDFSFGGWWVRRNEVLTVSSQTEAMSAEVWSAGPAAAPRPLDTFWARRFLVDPGNPASGPLCTPRATRPAPPGPRFSLDGLAASWIPYGGGKSLCPGRHFAKREMVLTTAVFLALFDIELAGQPRADSDMHHFGFGTMPPRSKIPCRIRRRSKA